MLHNVINFADATDASPVIRAFTIDPAVNPWLLILGLLATGAMIFYLYRVQRLIAKPGIVNALTVLRILLILLVFVLLFRPLRQWVNVKESGGALWVVADQSLSMAQTDPQSSPVERLRWADALGLISPEALPPELDRAAAEVGALHDELHHLQSQGVSADEPDLAARLAAANKALADWNDKLEETASALEKNASLSSSEAAAVPASLRKSLKLMRDGVAQSQAGAPTIPWSRVSSALEDDAALLTKAADHADTDYLARHAHDDKLADALARVGKMRRADLAAAAITGKSAHGLKGLDGVLDSQNTRVVSFAGGQQVVPTPAKSDLPKAIKSALEPGGLSTNLADALKFVGEQVGEGERASVLVVSDGRATDGGDLIEPARHLAAQGVRVFTLAVGSNVVAPDAAVENIDAPDWIYKDDTLRATALLRLDGLAGQACKVEFRRGDAVVGSQTVIPAQNQTMQTVTFTDTPPNADVYQYEVRVQEMPNETAKDNNRMKVRVAVKKDKLHALIVEDQPRWEYRYLLNYLARDQRVQLQTVLLEPAHVQDVSAPDPVKASPLNTAVDAQILPQTRQEWSGFDLIVLGDVPPEQLSPEAQQNLTAAVRDRGATLIVIAGPQNMPARYAGTPLAELLPVHLAGNWQPDDLQKHLHSGFRPTIAPEGAASILSQFGLDDASNAQLWGSLPPWYFHSEQTQAKQSASVLWTIGEPKSGAAQPAESPSLGDARQRALLCTTSVGLGRVLYLASDSTWRLRQVAGENLHERFWGQVIRWVVGNDLPAGGKYVRFGTNKPRYNGAEPVVVTARVLREDMTPLSGQTFRVLARTSPAAGGTGEVKLAGEAKMSDSPETPGFYRATLTGLPPGAVEISLQGDAIDKLLAADAQNSQQTLGIEIQPQLNLEEKNVNPDRRTLAQVAQASGGVALDATYSDILAGHIPSLSHKLATVEQVGLFTDPNDPNTRKTHWAFLLAFISIISAEWIVRKLGGLV